MTAPLLSEPLLGHEYALWRNGVYLGRAIFCDDEIHGKCFLRDIEENGVKMKLVCIADHWIRL